MPAGERNHAPKRQRNQTAKCQRHRIAHSFVPVR
jgi:hypothetical protein